MKAVLFAAGCIIATPALFAAGVVLTTVWFEKRYLPRMAGDE